MAGVRLVSFNASCCGVGTVDGFAPPDELDLRPGVLIAGAGFVTATPLPEIAVLPTWDKVRWTLPSSSAATLSAGDAAGAVANALEALFRWFP